MRRSSMAGSTRPTARRSTTCGRWRVSCAMPRAPCWGARSDAAGASARSCSSCGVRPDLRRQGLGARLVRAFEQQAAARGCVRVYLETFSFQAPRLYRSLGYEMRHTIAGYGPGIQKHWMVHELGAERDA